MSVADDIATLEATRADYYFQLRAMAAGTEGVAGTKPNATGGPGVDHAEATRRIREQIAFCNEEIARLSGGWHSDSYVTT